MVLLPQVSLAVANTVVVPIGNVLPLGGLAMINGGGLQPPLAFTLKNTAAPDGPVALTVMFVGQAMLKGAYTVTWKVHCALLPQVSLAVINTVVVPIGNVLPLGGLATILGGVQPPLADGEKNTTAPAGPLAATTMFDGQVTLTGR